MAYSFASYDSPNKKLSFPLSNIVVSKYSTSTTARAVQIYAR